MRRDTRPTMINNCDSSFLSCEKDIEAILRKLFVESYPYSNVLKRLLVVNTADCLDNEESQVIKDAVTAATLPNLKKNGYIKLEPKNRMKEHEEVKCYIIISMDSFTPNVTNPYYRDCTISFDIIAHIDYWDIGNYRIRPLKIAGYIDGILNNARLSGIGTLNFMGCTQLLLDDNLAGYSLYYRAIHGNDDKLAPEE